MRKERLAVLMLGTVLAVAACGKEDDTGEDAEASPTTAGPAVASDDAWCGGWQALVAVQAQYVGNPTPEGATVVLDTVDTLRDLGVPESLDPAGYTELTAVLDDVQASVDPSFTPTVVPSEPADVATHDGHDDGSHDASDAPFGAWLAEYCGMGG